MPEPNLPDWRAAVRQRLQAAGLSPRLAPAREAEIAEELAQDLEARHADLLTAGTPPELAIAKTLQELHGGRWDEIWREPHARPPAMDAPARGWTGLARDLRQGARRLRRSPGFTLAAVVSLALGIGANAAIFQLLNAVALRTLPVREPQRLALVHVISQGRTGDVTGYPAELTYALWQKIRAVQQGFSSLGAWYEDTVSAGDAPSRHNVRALLVSGGFFAALGLPPARGRLIGPEDDPPGCAGFHPAGLVLSYAYWESAFGGAPVVGRTLLIGGHPLPILGVSAAGFEGMNIGRSFDVALPLCTEPLLDAQLALPSNPVAWWLAAAGRLKPGWTLGRASAQLQAITPAVFAATVPASYDAHDRSHYLADRLTAVAGAAGVSSLRRQFEDPLWLMLALAALVLLIACANLANLMLARAGTRRREMAVRLALGASRRRLIRQLLAESALLAAAGAGLAAAVGWSASVALAGLLNTPDAHVMLNLAPDWRVWALLAGLAVGSCLLCGLAPAVSASRSSPAEALGASGRGLSAAARSPLRRALMVGQVALALVLVVGALLFASTLRNLLGVDLGFQTQAVAQGYADFSQVTPARASVESPALIAALRALPGVAAAATAEVIPLSGSGWNEDVAVVGAGRETVDFNAVSPGYFDTLRIPRLAGRTFTSADTASAPSVLVVNEAFSRQLLHGASPIGHTVRIAGDRGVLGPPATIVGVVGDTKYSSLRDPFVPIIYECRFQETLNARSYGVLLRVRGSQAGAAAAASAAVAKIDPAITLTLQPYRQTIRDALVTERLVSLLAECFAGLAALLALIGLYALIAYMAVQRRKEMGIRMALGAPPGRVVWLIVGEAWLLLALGLGAGLALAVLAGRAVRTMLFGVPAHDPRTLAAAVAGLAIAGTLAALLPARRAARLDPLDSLREE